MRRLKDGLRCALVGAIVGLSVLAGPSCSLPEPQATSYFDADWDDLSVYEQCLVADQHEQLAALHDATVYRIEMTVTPDLRAVSGQERVRYTNRENTALEAIYFRLFPNTAGGRMSIASAMVNDKAAPSGLESEESALKVSLPAPLAPGTGITLELDFTVELPSPSDDSDGLLGYADGILALDGFYPVVPAYDDSGWHTEIAPPFGDKTYLDASFYLVRISAPNGLTLITSGSEIERGTDGGQQSVTVAAGPARDFFIAGGADFSRVSATLGETTVGSYALPGMTEAANASLDVAAESLRVFNERLGQYPYRELDIVPLRLNIGAGIEYPGVIGISTGIYDNPDALESTVAHETGHQWSYNSVGNDQVNEPWIDEALTQYITGLYYLDRYGESGWQRIRATWLRGWTAVGQRRIPIGLPVAGYTVNEYVAVVYGRGPLFFEAVEEELGAGEFRRCLKEYYESNRWRTVNTASFQDGFEACSGVSLDDLMETWVLPPGTGTQSDSVAG